MGSAISVIHFGNTFGKPFKSDPPICPKKQRCLYSGEVHWSIDNNGEELEEI